MLNMYWESLEFEIPSLTGRRWFRAIDTAAPSPHDIADPGDEAEFVGNVGSVQGRSIVVLVSR
jgi:glycogen operon protein